MTFSFISTLDQNIPKLAKPTEQTMELTDGHSARIASIPNRRKDERYERINSDNAFIMQLPEAPDGAAYDTLTPYQSSPRGKMVVDAFAAAKSAVREITAKEHAETGRAKSGSGATLAFWDPKTQTLDARAVGDAPAFILFDDGEKQAAVCLANRELMDSKRPEGKLHLSESIDSHNPKMLTLYAYNQKGECLVEGNLQFPVHLNENIGIDPDLKKKIQDSRLPDPEANKLVLRQFITEAFGLDPDKTTATLVVASDGFALHPVEEGFPEWIAKTLPQWFAEAKNEENPAMALAQKAVQFHGKRIIEEKKQKGTLVEGEEPKTDDCTVAMIPLLEKGGPQVVFVADGMQQKGRECSIAAARAAKENLEMQVKKHLSGKSLETPLPPPSEAEAAPGSRVDGHHYHDRDRPGYIRG